ncbi:unnamed protein product, partial [Mesorhabditis belari]|uniref:Uncharacterized protein n=1 Tax=Mesorhabditis belari TaxID=2138241 RepID=A0AAF3ERR2_9BILA
MALIECRLKDVEPKDVWDEFWIQNDLLNVKNHLKVLFNQLHDLAADNALIVELYTLNIFLQKHHNLFAPFQKEVLNWADPEEVRTHLHAFLTAKEQQKRAEDERKALAKLEKEQEKEEKKKAKSNIEEDNTKPILLSEEKDKEEQGMLQKVWKYGASKFSASPEGKAFKDIENLISSHKSVFKPFQKLVKSQQTLTERFSYFSSSRAAVQQKAEPCSVPQSLIQMYFLSSRILDFNQRLYRYWKLYNKAVLSPNDWWSELEQLDEKLETHTDFITALANVTLPQFDSKMRVFMENHGLACSAYRHYISDELQVNLQVFRSSGLCEMRLVENINPHLSHVERLFINGTTWAEVQPNLGIRKMRQAIEDDPAIVSWNFPPNEISFQPWFNSGFHAKVDEWMRAVSVTADSKTFLAFLQFIYRLRGCASSLNEWQFMLNTFIECRCNLELNTEAIISMTLGGNGELRDIWLALRVLAALKGKSGDSVESMRKRLEEIREPRLRALLGSKLHEIELDEVTLNILIKMLAHANDRVVELAGMQLSEWVDIAKCQKWNDFEPLLKKYGAVGYYIVLLDSLKRPEVGKLKEIIDHVSRQECYIFEKTISRLVYLIAYKEVVFNDEYAKNVEQMLENLSNVDMICSLCTIDEHNMKRTEMINLVINERVQNEILGSKADWITNSLEKVFPKADRVLDHLIRFTTNPQDSALRAEERELELQHVKEIIERVNTKQQPLDDHLSKTFASVCAVLETKCKLRLRDTQKIAVLTAITSKSNLLSQVNTGEGKSYIIATLAIMRVFGTLGSVEESNSLVSLYDADLLRIPTFKPKIFNENIPVLSTKRKKWLQNVFEEVCDQISANRSILIICQSIAEVIEFEREFVALNAAYQEEESVNLRDKEKMNNCIKTLTVYKREFDEFEFPNGLLCSRLIISTNLAGRGTDIKLSRKLVAMGGLHVIVSFLPENSRIEDQAYGRAARCGEPGSGQIIAHVEEDTNSTTNIFQLKQFRDNAEVHRLKSLSDYYNYHIAVEERCLDLFRSHCSGILEQVYSGNDESWLPTKAQVIYFAMLDKWAHWVDARAEDIKHCEKSRSSNEKEAIINKVKKFLDTHPLPGRSCTIEEATQWIHAPQSLLTLALNDVCEDARHEEAEKQLKNIAIKFPFFAPEAIYYLGLLAQQQIRRLKTKFLEKKELTWEEMTKYNPLHYIQYARDKLVVGLDTTAVGLTSCAVEEIRDTPEWLIENSTEALLKSFRLLQHARGMLMEKIQRKAELQHIVTMLQNTSTSVLSTGYAAQCAEAKTLYETIIGNIDDMLGHTVKREDVRQVLGEGVDAERSSVEVLRALEYSGVISQVCLSKDVSLPQLQAIARSHAMSTTLLNFVFCNVRETDKLPENVQEVKVINSAMLLDLFDTPNALGFWKSLVRAGGFLQETAYLAVEKGKEIELLKGISKSEPTINPFMIQLTSKDLSNCSLYKMEDVAKALGADALKNVALEQHLTAGNASIELTGVLNPVIIKEIRLDEYDYVSVAEVSRQLNLPKAGAEMIIRILEKHEVLYQVEAKFTDKEGVSQSDDSGIEDEPKQKDDEENQLTIKPKEFVYRLKNRINCEMLPQCMRATVQQLLARQLAYGYALQNLQASTKKIIEECKGGDIKDNKFQLSIILPQQPHMQLFDDLLKVGILQRQRVTKVIDDVYGEEKGFWGNIYRKLKPKQPTILINKSTLIPIGPYLDEKCAPVGMERNRVVANGMRLVANIETPNPWRYYPRLFAVLLPIAAVVIGVAAIFLSPIVVLIAIGIVAAVGTTLFFMSLFTATQRAATITNMSKEEEFHLVQDCHKTAISRERTQRRENLILETIGEVFCEFSEKCLESLMAGAFVTTSDEEIEQAKELIAKCFTMDSEHITVLREGINGWIMKATSGFQKECYDTITNGVGQSSDTKVKQKLRKHIKQFLVGVFEALREKFPRFADRYMMEAGLFIRDLAKAVELRGEAKSFWKRTVTWHADEKLVCKMAF